MLKVPLRVKVCDTRGISETKVGRSTLARAAMALTIWSFPFFVLSPVLNSPRPNEVRPTLSSLYRSQKSCYSQTGNWKTLVGMQEPSVFLVFILVFERTNPGYQDSLASRVDFISFLNLSRSFGKMNFLVRFGPVVYLI